MRTIPYCARGLFDGSGFGMTRKTAQCRFAMSPVSFYPACEKNMSSSSLTASFRSYRRAAPHAGERSFQIVVEQSDLWITVGGVAKNAPCLRETSLARVRELRSQISAWMLLDPAFAGSLTPVAAPGHAPEVIRRMCEASAVMGVGPMATVAGAVAALTAEALLPWCSDCMVENGGDSMLHSTKERIVALLPDPGRKAVLGLRIPAEAFPLSLCASSGRFGHSLSFGNGDLAVVRARDAFLADAAATAFCNMLKTPDDAGRTAEHAATFQQAGIDGVFLQCGSGIGIWGDMELVAL